MCPLMATVLFKIPLVLFLFFPLFFSFPSFESNPCWGLGGEGVGGTNL